MLLPSAFSCADSSSDTSTSSSHFHLQRPKLQSFGEYQPRQSSSHHAVAATAVATRINPLSSSCRALQAILGVPQSTTTQNLDSSSLTLFEPPSDPFMLPDHNPHPSGPVRQPPPSPPRRTAVKRRRSEFERDYFGRSTQDENQDQSSSLDIHMDDYSPSPRQHQRTSSSPAAVTMMRTPKRRRRIPLSMPLGLCADDFRGLETPPEEIEMPPNTNVMMTMNTASPCHHDQNHLVSTHQSQTTLCGRSIGGYSDRDRDRDPERDSDSAYASGSASCSVSSSSGSSGSGSSPFEANEESEEWTLEDDRMLVETVLEKLKLTKRDWNDCARRLGRDKDSLGRRWSLLVDRGNVGLRRGSGRRSRTDLDISSW
ncbi:hypothetical protein HRR83_002902 [Exophiala dermatitidis]|uniref:Myb-like domain-containing protein n=2 Tax=Exophiala dermatitidis TaxID=5970 RepID=H6BXS6_EXODN|nr:uncharacterized protein HMPREF1120_05454 [Exophiala dermatitidis NIH/UT8656]KAJ4520667.1 hypothetical protein HRR74_003667 [Exophiala dermatitidis]EHY57416.1 hypothetical protein HMPREF1120_05454 [Exophiala dermatitidis NIH/UT8656]KAJ4521809.1 hypothetical protein HRR73_003007 [Exophiala dermatitidis]KAJ4537689.1 hypothetical protein HRR76_005679 [Exophiala dermatitidis]KAJ4551646.1 hypothetical protein HRR77_002880 [Exophiala dermatitidis]